MEQQLQDWIVKNNLTKEIEPKIRHEVEAGEYWVTRGADFIRIDYGIGASRAMMFYEN